MTDELLTVEEVAARLKVGEFTVRKWLNEGKLKGAKINNDAWRVKESDLLAFIDSAYKEGVNGKKTTGHS